MSAPFTQTQEATSTRPSIPVSVWLAATFWAGIRAAESLAWHAPKLSHTSCWLAAGLFLIGGVVIARAQDVRARFAALVILGVCGGLLAGGLFWVRADGGVTRLRTLVAGAPVRLLADASRSRFGYSVRCGVLEGPARGLSFSASLPAEGALPLSGETLTVHGSPDTAATRDAFARRSHQAGLTARVRVWRVADARPGWSFVGSVAPLRRLLVGQVARIDGDKGALLQGMLLGEKSRLDGTEIEAAFRTTGLSHILAVSGTHLVIVAYTVGAVLGAAGVSRRSRTCVVLVFAGLYVLLTGAPVSAVRALGMTASATVAGGAGRRGDALSGLALAVCAILCISPPQAFDVGFALSVSAVAGLVVFSGLATEWARALAGRTFRRGAEVLVTPLVAQAATAPIAIPVFNMLSVISPLANVIALPPSSLSLGVGVFGAAVSLVAPSPGLLVLRVAAWPLELVARIVRSLANVPGAAVAVGGSAFVWGAAAAGVGALVWVVWPAPRRIGTTRVVLACALAASMWFVADGARVTRGPEVVVLDVGQGDAILVRDGSRAVLVDTGPDEASLRAALARVRVRRLDAVLLTHPHADHTGGLGALPGLVPVGRFCVPAATAEEFSLPKEGGSGLASARVETLAAGDGMRFGSWQVEIMWPPAVLPREHDCNDASLVLRLSAPGGGTVVLTGDAEAATQRAIAASHDGLGECDVLKVPHHGSSGSLDDGALEVWDPAFALVSVGEGNEFGHPHQATLDQLRRSGVGVLRTDHVGDIRCRPRGSGLRLTTSRKQARAYFVRGGSAARCATIASADMRVRTHSSRGRNGTDGTLRSLRPQARLPDPRTREPASGAGNRPPQEAFCRCRGP